MQQSLPEAATSIEREREPRAKIAVDQREDGSFVSLLSGMGADVDRRVLQVGDFICSSRLVVERKTRADFEQSIIDGRLFSQLGNLTASYPRVVVIVEGESAEGRLDARAVLGAYAAVISDFGAALFFTRGMEKTAELVFSLAKHEQLGGKQPMRIFAKRKSLTPSQGMRALVESLPMVGPKLARRILVHFGNIENFVNASEGELLEVEGMGKKRAKIIRGMLATKYDSEEDGFSHLGGSGSGDF